MPDPDLRALCQAVVDARAAWCAEADEHESAARGVTYLGAQDALREFLGRDRPNDEDILAVLNAERAAADARGYARAMGEVVAEVQARTEVAVSSYYADRSSYREGYSDACDTLCELMQHMAQTKRD